MIATNPGRSQFAILPEVTRWGMIGAALRELVHDAFCVARNHAHRPEKGGGLGKVVMLSRRAMMVGGALMTVAPVSRADDKRIPRVIVFDTFGTLVDWRSSLIRYLTDFGARRGINADWAKLIDAWRAQYMPSLNSIRSREQPWATLDELHRASLEKLVVTQGIGGLSSGDLDYIVNGWHKLSPWPDVIPGLKRLQRKFITGPLSNGNVSLLVDLAKFGELPWDMVFGADIFEHYKPDREIYTGVAKLLRVPVDSVMLAAAHNNDLGAAKGFGLMTAFIARPTEYGPGQTTDLKPDQNFTCVATSVEDLAQQLGAWRGDEVPGFFPR